MKKLLLLLAILLSLFNLQAQVDAGGDISLTQGLPYLLSGNYTGITGIPVTGGDDYFVGPFDIGFEFEYFGETCSQFAVSPNGLVSFDLPDILDLVEWEEAPIPNNIFKKTIMGPYQDLFTRPALPHSEFIFYRTVGQEPERRLIVGWCEAPMFKCLDLHVTAQIVLYEDGYQIENHLVNKPACEASLGNRATHGLNYDDALGVVVPGRNNTSWTAFGESWLFTPNGAGSYSVDQIDFLPEVIVPQGKIEWAWFKDSYPGGERISDEKNVLVNPTETTTYFCEITLCSGLKYVDDISITSIPVPTAFQPNSEIEENRIFKVFANPPEKVSNYLLIIYNRWGQEVFTSNDITVGWDGTLDGKPCSQGVYVWAIALDDENGKVTNTGMVTLVK
ncbi:MAG: gliding motility-associated C-terminal domain-containing protein [Bacteroidales bacterium]|nr:gliding motility-associated C-terminal domain-containing protein [Bacteroidales bacterium]MCF8404419.1 gliding motility-associated C-terminal domain-containing protein [Bacteroidales bacterium]